MHLSPAPLVRIDENVFSSRFDRDFTTIARNSEIVNKFGTISDLENPARLPDKAPAGAARVWRRIGTDLIRRAGARRLPAPAGQLGFFVHSAHQPLGEISPSTSLHALGATNWMQPSH